MIGSAGFSRYHTSPQSQGRRVDREHAELTAGDHRATFSARARDRVAVAVHMALMRVADEVSIFQPGVGVVATR
jgi:hypothetical protein